MTSGSTCLGLVPGPSNLVVGSKMKIDHPSEYGSWLVMHVLAGS